MDNIDIDHSLNGPLESTNRVLSDLERKLSISSTTSSNQTHQSQHSSSSSVVVNRNLNGIGKRTIQSEVISYINNNESEFNTNELFHERQKVFLTKFVKNYNDESPKAPVNTRRTINLPSNGNASVSGTESENSRSHYEPPDDGDGTYIDVLNDSDIDDNSEDDTQSDEDSTFLVNESKGEKHDEILYKDEDLNEEDDMQIPPSPPRSPPRLIDPEKLYGLYDFSGPDPSHCKLSRNEPVQLINDQDNYWWLIRKLTKEEKKLHKQNKINLKYDNGKEYEHEDDHSEDEEGKIGFVPAECLETYGERLARLNCFKNEKLEKSSRENINENTGLGILLDTSYGGLLCEQDKRIDSNSTIERFEDESRGNKINRPKVVKSVTFENLDTLKMDDYDDEDGDDITSNEDFNDMGFNPYYQFSGEDMYKSPNEEERASEVLSDVYPVNEPLLINKNKRKTTNKVLKIVENNDEIKSLSQPPVLNQNYDEISIGSFSPDTPKNPPSSSFPSNSSPGNSSNTNGIHEVENDNGNEQSMLRRSVILERLNQVTTDIQAFQLNDYETFDNDNGDLIGLSQDDPDAYNQFNTNNDSCDDSIDESGYVTNDGQLEDGDTPLTSMNSLNNAYFPTPTHPSDVSERRQSKPVLDMFVPILGKFDELAEKLAKLNEIL